MVSQAKVRHVVLLTWKPTATAAQKRAAEEAFHDLPRHVTQISALSCGSALEFAEGGADFAAVLDFASADDWRAYQEHPAHRALVAERLAPILAGRSVIQFDA
ncbi:Dabb family protein [Actinocorallia sp. A-T 12471]|uniref:Dabb family protein n=1 Tax=Actinocorallia sp. A-T 12471 TaxID=3089813 RepID=UPI0029CC8B8C|nr:Dabb family protein [Actinocorallia sp. A-T 12471]MDX6744068.1 Dabb family protein [Actinocorallia sp. A-T 12471]